MPLLSFLISFLGKKIGSIIQAIFGWSITALFGRLEKKKQMAVTVALVLSLAWPIFVVGLFFPSVAAWVIAFLPLEKWVGPLALRIVWAVLAVISPPIVGMLVQWAAPSKKTTFAKSLIHGYPLALGFFIAFLITVVTVPLVKLASIIRGWADEHVYVQARNGRYDDVVRELAEACARAGLEPEIAAPPTRMMLATNVLKFFAKGTVSPIVAEEVKVIKSEDLELYLYPSDLLIRGKKTRAARVRAMMTRTELDKDAYLVGSPDAQCIQDELGRLLDVVADHEKRHHDVGRLAGRRIVEIYREMNETMLPFEEWVLLESIARRVERKLVAEHVGVEELPLDREDDGLAKLAKKQDHELVKQEKKQMSFDHPSPERLTLEEASTADLVREALDEAKELVKIEVALAKDEVKKEVAQMKRAAIGFGIGLVFSVLFLTTMATALVLALGGTALVALAVAGGFLLIGGIAAYAGYAMMPKKPLERTRHRLETDVNQLKEHFA